MRRQNVENFILSRLSQLSNDNKSPEEVGEEPHSHNKCADLVRSIEDSLECPVCRDRVHGEVSTNTSMTHCTMGKKGGPDRH